MKTEKINIKFWLPKKLDNQVLREMKQQGFTKREIVSYLQYLIQKGLKK